MNRRHQRGIALILVLWAAALLTLISGSFALSMRTERQLSANMTGRAEARSLAEAAVNRGVLALLHPDPDKPWLADGTVYSEPFGTGEVRISIRAETGKIDINVASLELIQGMLEQAGAANAIALSAAIVDWRDADSVTTTGGAEDDDYRAAGLDYGAADGPFLTASELNRVLGMSGKVASNVGEIATVYARRAKLDPDVASREALLSLPNVSADEVDAYLESRRASREAGTVAPTTSLAAGAQYLQSSGGARRNKGIFTVDGEGVTSAGIRLTIRAIVQITRQRQRPYWMLSWREGGPSLDAAPAGVPKGGV